MYTAPMDNNSQGVPWTGWQPPVLSAARLEAVAHVQRHLRQGLTHEEQEACDRATD